MPDRQRRLHYRHRVHRSYIAEHVPLSLAVRTALRWAGTSAAIHVPSSSVVNENEWIEQLQIPITSSSMKSRFHGSPRGVVIGLCLDLLETLAVERCAGVDGIVVVPAQDRVADRVPSHAPWITAFDVECLTGLPIDRVRETPAPIKAAVQGLSGGMIGQQGLADRRERFAAVQTLTHLRDNGVDLDPDGLMVEALRNEWGGTGPEDLREIAVDLNAGKMLRYVGTIRSDRLSEWLRSK